MKRARVLLSIAALSVSGVLVAGCGSSSKESTSSGGVTAGGSGTTVNIVVSDTKGTDGPMTLVPDVTSAKAGSVTFTVKNTGTIEHEVVALKIDTPFDQLPVATSGSDKDKVDEATSVGEAEVKKGETKSFTVKDMKAGKYVLVCNIAKHYAMGMRAAFTVS
jgi:uncharacterized cupredoxin-like copper-binding protein